MAENHLPDAGQSPSSRDGVGQAAPADSGSRDVVSASYVASSFYGTLDTFCSYPGDTSSYFEFDGSRYHMHLSPTRAAWLHDTFSNWADWLWIVGGAVIGMLTRKGIDSVNSGGVTLSRGIVGATAGAFAAQLMINGWYKHVNPDGSVDWYSGAVDFNNVYLQGSGTGYTAAGGYYTAYWRGYTSCK